MAANDRIDLSRNDRSQNPGSTTIRKQKLRYAFSEFSTNSSTDDLAKDGDDAEPKHLRQALSTTNQQQGKGKEKQGTFLNMLVKKWDEAVRALAGFHIEEAYRRMRDVLDSCHKEDFEHPRAAALYANIGILHWHLGEQDGAKKYIAKAVEQAPQLAIHRFLYGGVCFELGEYEEAAQAFDACLSAFSDDVEMLDCEELGLDYVLEKDAVAHNLKVSQQQVDLLRSGKSADPMLGIWRLPGRIIFGSSAMLDASSDRGREHK